MAGNELTKDIVCAALGEIDNLTMTRILDIGATIEEFEEAVAWAAEEGEPLGKAARPLVGAVAEVFEILMAERETGEEREP